MADAPPLSTQASPAFLERFRSKAGPERHLRFDRFMELALYDPEVGYYRQNRARVGYGRGTDFFTATTSGPLFGELIAAAALSLLGTADPRQFTFVEIGAEPGRSVLDGVAHPFRQTKTLRVGEPLVISGTCVVFSNELFDAQPFRRFVREGGAWKERVVCELDNRLVEETRDLAPAELPSMLPTQESDGYELDLPFAARDLAVEIAAQPWTGLFLAFDYGKSWREIVEATPRGTARAYYRHTQSNDLLARPGEQDLTCHVCWDWLSDALSGRGFKSPTVESQEAFFIHHAGRFIAETSAAEASRFSQRKLSLMQLLHPAHLGQKFQVLHGLRE